MFFMGKKLKVKGHDVKLSPLEFMILLKIYDADPIGISGYDLINGLTKTFAGMWVAQSGTIYPLLSRMQGDKYIIGEEQKSEVGPAKKVFRLTDTSRSFIEIMLVDNFEPELMFFGNYLDMVTDMMIKVKKRSESSSGINYEGIKHGLALFSSHVEETRDRFETAIRELDSSNIRSRCLFCNSVIDREAKFCPKCGAEVQAIVPEVSGSE
jgi:DNA-binding PadR family transcriptional regulator